MTAPAPTRAPRGRRAEPPRVESISPAARQLTKTFRMSWRSTSSISPSISTPSPKNPGRFACRDNEKCALLRSPRGRGGSLASSRTTFTSSLLPSVASCLTAPMKPNSATGAVASASSAPQFEHARERDRGTLDRHSAPRMPRPSPAHRSAPSRCTARDATPTTSARACRRRQRQPPVDDRPCLCRLPGPSAPSRRIEPGRDQPTILPSEPDGVGSGSRIMRKELNNPMRPASSGMSSAT